MTSNRTFIIFCSSLFLMGLAGCSRTTQVEVGPALVPMASAAPGDTVEWVATAPGESFDVVFQSGLCTQASPIHATYEHPALCTVAKQSFESKTVPILYTYHFEGVRDGRPVRSPDYQASIGPGGCPHCKT